MIATMAMRPCLRSTARRRSKPSGCVVERPSGSQKPAGAWTPMRVSSTDAPPWRSPPAQPRAPGRRPRSPRGGRGQPSAAMGGGGGERSVVRVARVSRLFLSRRAAAAPVELRGAKPVSGETADSLSLPRSRPGRGARPPSTMNQRGRSLPLRAHFPASLRCGRSSGYHCSLARLKVRERGSEWHHFVSFWQLEAVDRGKIARVPIRRNHPPHSVHRRVRDAQTQ